MKYGEAIRKVRALRGISQNHLAKRAGLDASYISFIERGHRVPSTKALESIAAALDVPLYLVTLMASDKSELRGLSKDDAGKLASSLFDALLCVETDHE